MEAETATAAAAETEDGAVIGEWGNVEESLWRVFRDAGDLRKGDLHKLAQLEIAYYRADLDVALERADDLIATAQHPIAVHARTVRMLISIARGDADAAYADFVVLEGVCKAGLAQRDDMQLFSTCLISALRIESSIMHPIFELPEFTEGTETIPTGLKLYFGYVMAMHTLRFGHTAVAAGMAYSYLTLLGPRYPGARTYLYCIEASANMLMNDVELARKRFEQAWKLKDSHGIIMPFVELNYALLGLPRVNREALATPEEKRLVDSLVRSARKGWYGLRRKCGLPVDTETLTPLESYTSGLAALGWRNKEIAQHLVVSENTVKHQLTSVYQKLGVDNRADLQQLMRLAASDGPASGRRPGVTHMSGVAVTSRSGVWA